MRVRGLVVAMTIGLLVAGLVSPVQAAEAPERISSVSNCDPNDPTNEDLFTVTLYGWASKARGTLHVARVTAENECSTAQTFYFEYSDGSTHIFTVQPESTLSLTRRDLQEMGVRLHRITAFGS